MSNKKMKLRKATIGVRHKNCWGSLCTLQFPNIIMNEKGPINVEKIKKGVRLSATWSIDFKNKKEFHAFLRHLKTYKMLEKIQVIDLHENSALLKTIWTNKKSSYDIVLKNNCLYTSPVTQKEGFEVYDVITQNPKKLIKVLNELEDIGEAKLFSIGRVIKENPMNLTEKQSNALQLAVSHDFYEWPRKISLDEISAIHGMKRRTFQENLRKAEAKLVPKLIKSFFERAQ
tara:strand:+ start:1425 stop:2114 length:690 start_codon:yes stop_codon:yes gene_type:complete